MEGRETVGEGERERWFSPGKGCIPGNIASGKTGIASGWIVYDFTLRERRLGPREDVWPLSLPEKVIWGCKGGGRRKGGSTFLKECTSFVRVWPILPLYPVCDDNAGAPVDSLVQNTCNKTCAHSEMIRLSKNIFMFETFISCLHIKGLVNLWMEGYSWLLESSSLIK